VLEENEDLIRFLDHGFRLPFRRLRFAAQAQRPWRSRLSRSGACAAFRRGRSRSAFAFASALAFSSASRASTSAASVG
jgi:hypothetical protein